MNSEEPTGSADAEHEDAGDTAADATGSERRLDERDDSGLLDSSDLRASRQSKPGDHARPGTDSEHSVGRMLTMAAGNLGNEQEKRWRIRLDAPRWAIVRYRHEAWLAIGLFILALGLGVFGLLLAWHLANRFPSGTTGTPAPPLTEQIGSWVAVVIVVGGALAAGVTAFRSAKLHMEVMVEPSTKAEAVRAEELHARLIGALDKHADAPDGPAAIAAAVVAALQEKETVPSTMSSSSIGQASDPAPVSGQSTAGSRQDLTPAPGQVIVDPSSKVSPKVLAGGAGAVTSAAFWTIAAATFWHNMNPTVLTALGTGVTTALGSFAAWLKTDPLRTTHVVESRPARQSSRQT